MGKLSTRTSRRLEAARASFPDWDIIEVFGGYLAVPAGTPVVQAIDTDGIVSKLRVQEMQHDHAE